MIGIVWEEAFRAGQMLLEKKQQDDDLGKVKGYKGQKLKYRY